MKRIINILLLFAFAVQCKGPNTGCEVNYQQQSIPLSGVPNARQLGGYVIGGKTIKKDLLLRTAALGTATDEDLQWLDSVGVAKVFDFRSSKERAELPDREIPGCTNYWLPCLEDVLARTANDGGAEVFLQMRSHPEMMGPLMSDPRVTAFAEGMYPGIVFSESSQKSYAEFIDGLCSLEEGQAALWHCSQGKDRCGWGSAFVLACLGAPKELIVADFELSNEGYRQELSRLISLVEKQGYGDTASNNIYALIGVSKHNFEETLAMIDEMYGSLDNFMSVALGVTEEKKALLRSRYLE